MAGKLHNAKLYEIKKVICIFGDSISTILLKHFTNYGNDHNITEYIENKLSLRFG
uniref:Uncharacterized protein n=1 Tax=Rhizophagus irregularis (strain DAOM 181602 / DAOM 197198 / MUCL 43194) TaxID=747089 RepID=U9SMG3_RHIID